MQCGKITYKDKIGAMMALASCRKARKGNRQEQRIYYCKECRGWHLTKKEKR